MKRRCVLFFAYHFPPESAIGGLRPYRFYKYLPQHGYTCHVITAADVTSRPDLSADYLPDPFLQCSGRGMGWQIERLIRKVLLPGVIGTQWSIQAYRAGAKFIDDNADAEITIFSTWPPLGTHLVAWRLANRYRLPWIADFRDPLAGNPAYANFGKHTHATYAWLESRFIHAADSFIANTDEAQRAVRERHPTQKNKVHLLWNGFDPQARIEPLPLPERSHRVFSHVGELYEGRTAAPLLQSLARLIAAGRVSPSALQIQLVGPAADACLPEPSLLQRAQEQGWLEVIRQQVPKAEAQHISQTSDGLLIIQPHSAIQVPGKLFEYLQIGRPILALAPRQSSIERVLERSGIRYRAVYTDDPSEQFDASVLGYLNLPNTPSQPSQWFEETFNAQPQTAYLAKLIDHANGR